MRRGLSDNVIRVGNHLVDGIRKLKVGFGSVFGLDAILEGNIQFWEDFVGCSDLQFALLLTEPVRNKMNALDEGDIESESGSGKAGVFAESLDNTGLHGGDKLKHEI